MGASAPAGLSRSRATISLCLAKPFAHGERPAQRDPEVVRDAEPVMQPHRRYAVANLCICACQPKREGTMTSEALFGLTRPTPPLVCESCRDRPPPKGGRYVRYDGPPSRLPATPGGTPPDALVLRVVRG